MEVKKVFMTMEEGQLGGVATKQNKKAKIRTIHPGDIFYTYYQFSYMRWYNVAFTM